MARLTFTDDQVLALHELFNHPATRALVNGVLRADIGAALQRVNRIVEVRAEDIVDGRRPALRLVTPVVHTHGTEDGPGLACNERLIDGRLYGACQPDPEGADRG